MRIERRAVGYGVGTAAVTSGLAVAVNLATDAPEAAWTWVAVGVLTVVVGVVSAVRGERGSAPPPGVGTIHVVDSTNVMIGSRNRQENVVRQSEPGPS